MRTLFVAVGTGFLAGCVPPFDAEPPVVLPPTPTSPTPGTTPLEITGGPTVQPLGHPEIRLVHVLDVTTSEPTTLTVVLDGGGSRREIAFPETSESHSVPLLGLIEDTSYTTTVTLETGEGASVSSEVVFTSESGFDVRPHISVLVSDPSRMEPGYTLFPSKGQGNQYALLQAIDNEGRPVWQYKPVPLPDNRGSSITAVKFHPEDGTITALVHSNVIHRLDPTATLDTTWRNYADAEPTDISVDVEGSFHHEAAFEPDGSFWTLTKSTYPEPLFPLDELEPDVLGPVLLEVDVVSHVAVDGTTIGSWKLSDYLDTQRTGYGVTPDPEADDDKYEWSDATAIVPLLDDDGSFLVTVRSQDAIVKLSGEAMPGDLPEWILAPHETWNPKFVPLLLTADPEDDSGDWPAHQAGIEMIDATHLLVFDNGNNGHGNPYNPQPERPDVSRVVQFDLGCDPGTVHQDYDFTADGFNPLFSEILGAATSLPITGNVLATFGSLTEEGGLPNTEAGLGLVSMRLIEFDPDDEGAIVWDARVNSPVEESTTGWQGDRAYRIPTLYPNDVIETVLD